MKKYSFIVSLTIVVLLFVSSCSTQDQKNQVKKEITEQTSTYDSLLAKEYGADDYGMKQYVMAFLKKGPNRDQSPEEATKLQMAHLKNIDRLANEGKLVLAGPFLADQEIRGIYIFDVKTVEEARELTNTDPAIQAGRLEMELMEWYGSAGLKALNEIHKKLEKKSVSGE